MVQKLVPVFVVPFLLGLGAGAIAIAISFLLRLLTGGLFIPELASQTLFSLTPGDIESQAVGTLGSLAKLLTFVGAIIANIALYGLLGVALNRLYEKLPWKGYFARAIRSSLLAYFVLFIVAILLLNTSELQAQSTSISDLALYLLPPHIAFGFALASLHGRFARPSSIVYEKVSDDKIKIDYNRRLMIRAGIGAAVALPILFYGLDFLFTRQASPPSSLQTKTSPSQSLTSSGFDDPRLEPLLRSEVTPNDLFYQVDTNLITPSIDAKAWKLTLKGLVNNPSTITYDELKAMPSVEEYATLECISNKIGEDLIGTALWKGVRLKDLLEKTGINSETEYIVFRCYDGYDVGIPLEKALMDGTILAYEMNGVPLPAGHGYPLRAIVPGLYGMMNAKWITEIELVNKVYEGFWQRRGWSNIAEYNTHSFAVNLGDDVLRQRFRGLTPPNVVLGGKVPIAGIAFAGDREISKVEVSVDDGATWQDASVKDPLSQYTWVLWAAEWNPSSEGNYKITVRATDKTGKVQTAELRKPFPDGATGYHVINIKVRA